MNGYGGRSRADELRAQIAAILGALRAGGAGRQDGSMPVGATPPAPGVRMLDWMFAPERTAPAPDSDGPPLDQILPAGMISFKHTAPAGSGAGDLWDERGRGMLFAPSEKQPARKPASPRKPEAPQGMSPELAYGGIDPRIGTPQNSLGRWEVQAGDAVTMPAVPKQTAPPHSNAEPPAIEPVDADAMYRRFGFDPNGLGRWTLTAEDPFRSILATGLGGYTQYRTGALQRAGDLPPGKAENDEADAFRHALWNYHLTQTFGADFAKAFTDAHEITRPNDHGIRLMDLHNNDVGRRLALDPANRGRPAEEIVLEALKNGLLQTRPFTIITVGSRSIIEYNYHSAFDRALQRWLP